MEKHLLLLTQVRQALWKVICKNDAVLTGPLASFEVLVCVFVFLRQDFFVP